MASGDLVGTVSSEQYLPAACFNGTTDYIELPHTAQQLGSNLASGFTISCWIKPRNYGEGAAADSGTILDKSSSTAGTNGFRLSLRDNTTDKKVIFQLNGGGSKVGSATSSVTLGTWMHVLINVSAAAKGTFYINGAISGTASQNLTGVIADITTTNVTRIGNRATSTDLTFDGCIAKIRMWNRNLTAAERALDYGGSIVTDGLIMNYELNGNAYDSSVFHNDGTESGAYYTNVPFNNILTDVKFRNLATVTDKLFVVPMFGRNSQVLVVSANRTP